MAGGGATHLLPVSDGFSSPLTSLVYSVCSGGATSIRPFLRQDDYPGYGASRGVESPLPQIGVRWPPRPQVVRHSAPHAPSQGNIRSFSAPTTPWGLVQRLSCEAGVRRSEAACGRARAVDGDTASRVTTSGHRTRLVRPRHVGGSRPRPRATPQRPSRTSPPSRAWAEARTARWTWRCACCHGSAGAGATPPVASPYAALGPAPTAMRAMPSRAALRRTTDGAERLCRLRNGAHRSAAGAGVRCA